jgi:hypothetical protein
MTKSPLTIASTLALLLASASTAFAAGPAGIAKSIAATQPDSIVERAHSVYEAKHKLRYLGYYAIQIERASEPYSFIACKRGQRFHIHVDYYGDLVQVDDAGSCENYGYNDGSRYYEPRRRYHGGYRTSGYNRYRGDGDY